MASQESTMKDVKILQSKLIVLQNVIKMFTSILSDSFCVKLILTVVFVLNSF